VVALAVPARRAAHRLRRADRDGHGVLSPGPHHAGRASTTAPAESRVTRMSVAPAAASALDVDGVTCRFGGVIAVSDVSCSVARGELFGLIGPNGAGKTTLFNLITGLTEPSGGRLRHRGEDITGLPPYRIAERGIARTFQNVRLFGELGAVDNVMIAPPLRPPSALLTAPLRLPRAREEERATRERAEALLETVGLADRLHERARNFSYGDQRRLEIARALALEPELLLLDEPAAGMNTGEKRALTELIRSVRARLGLTVLLIEHHVPLVMDLCDEIAVLNFGQLIALGPPAEVQRHPAVIEAYLGDSA